MNLVQRFFTAIFPKHWGELMRADSERWQYRCLTCGAQRSLWEAGEIRWNTGSPSTRVYKWCPACRWPRWCALEYHAEGERARFTD